VLHHHERWDGAGYPERLEGEAIPLASRIIAVADSADAMIRSEGDRPGMSLEDISREIESCSGAQFDPQVAAAFARLARAGEIEL
jgi:HD-GYP domain-containing protein (c-di-GMP phosphodiesterase class II)